MTSRPRWCGCAPSCSAEVRSLIAALLLCSAFTVSAQGQRADTPANRRAAAEALFNVPVYRQLATRQLYQAIGTLPEGQRERARAGLSDPAVVGALRFFNDTATTEIYTVRELDYLARMLSATEARAFLDKSDLFQATLARELFAAALTNPDLHRLLAAP